MLWLTIAMIGLAVIATIGLIVDPRVTLGAPLWGKPLKVALSIALYALTLSWLIGMLTRHARLAWLIGTVSAVFLAVEMVVIVGAATLGTTSHFNVATPLTTTPWSVMAISIVIVWSAAMLMAALLCHHRIAGAHTVGLPDCGDGLPLLGWSTVAGDLRIPHFVGMHALQLLPLAALALELMARQFPALQRAVTRRHIVVVLVALYVAITGLRTAQALMGQSIVKPDAAVAITASLLFAGAGVAIAGVVARAARHLALPARQKSAPAE